MDNLAIDYEKKQRLENARTQQAVLGRQMRPDNYAQDLSIKKIPAHLRTGSLQAADTYVNSSKRNRPNDLHLKQGGEENESNSENEELKEAPEREREKTHAERFAEVINADKKSSDKANINPKKVVELATPMGAFSLLKQINFLGDMPFFAAFGAALPKDLLDAVFNVVLIGAILTLLCSIFIFMMMLLTDSGQKRKTAKGIMKKGLMLVSGGIIDSIPGIGFLPIETLTVGIIYVMTLIERRNNSNEE